MTDQQRLEAMGWDVTQTSLYDEEAVEGWCWSKGSREIYEIGSWSEPPEIPDELQALLSEQ